MIEHNGHSLKDIKDYSNAHILIQINLAQEATIALVHSMQRIKKFYIQAESLLSNQKNMMIESLPKLLRSIIPNKAKVDQYLPKFEEIMIELINFLKTNIGALNCLGRYVDNIVTLCWVLK